MKRKLGAFERALTLTDDYSPFNVVAIVRLDAQPTQCSTVDTLTYRHVGKARNNLQVAGTEKMLRLGFALLRIDRIVVEERMAAYFQRRFHFVALTAIDVVWRDSPVDACAQKTR